MRVKGTLLLDYVKTIRANQDRDYSEYLTAEDWEIINGKILVSQWYPFDSFRRIAFATFEVVGEGKLELARGFGRFMIRDMMSVYRKFLVPGDQSSTIAKLASLRPTFFDGEVKLEVTETGFRHLRMVMGINEVEPDSAYREAFYEAFAGNLEAIVEDTGARLIKVSYQEKEHDGQFLVVWDNQNLGGANEGSKNSVTNH